MEKYVQLRGLPRSRGHAFERLCACGGRRLAGFRAREGPRYRHAVWQGFGAQPAADAAVYMDWLAQRTPEAALATRLTEAAVEARSQVAPEAYYSSAVSHVRYPMVPLLYGHVDANVRQATQIARNLFEPV